MRTCFGNRCPTEIKRISGSVLLRLVVLFPVHSGADDQRHAFPVPLTAGDVMTMHAECDELAQWELELRSQRESYALRIVFADWLDEQGDPRGLAIRLCLGQIDLVDDLDQIQVWCELFPAMLDIPDSWEINSPLRPLARLKRYGWFESMTAISGESEQSFGEVAILFDDSDWVAPVDYTVEFPVVLPMGGARMAAHYMVKGHLSQIRKTLLTASPRLSLPGQLA